MAVAAEAARAGLRGADYVAGSNIGDRHSRNLRAKLQTHSRHARYIATVPGRVYRLASTAADDAPSQ